MDAIFHSPGTLKLTHQLNSFHSVKKPPFPRRPAEFLMDRFRAPLQREIRSLLKDGLVPQSRATYTRFLKLLTVESGAGGAVSL